MTDEDICPFGPKLQKCWNARYGIMSKFDHARVTAETIYTITPQWAAMRMANAIHGKNVLEICSGAGGMSIAFARSGKHVTGIDNNPERIEDARHNAGIYDVSPRVNFIQADALEFVSRPEVKQKSFALLFIDPPWGNGPGYYRTKQMITMEDLALGHEDLRDIAAEVSCKYVGMKLPYNFNYESMAHIKPTIRQDYGFLGTAEESGFWRYSLVVMKKDEFLSIPRPAI